MYPQKSSIVGIVLGAFGVLQLFFAALMVLTHYEIIDLYAIIEGVESEFIIAILYALSAAVYNVMYFEEAYIVFSISLVVSGSMYIAFYIILNKLKQNNAMLKEMYRRMNKY